MLTLNELKKELVKKGYSTQESADKAETKVLSITADWDINDNIIVRKVSLGIFGGGTVYKGMPADVKLPKINKNEDFEITEKNFKSDIERMYPDCEVWLRVD